MKKYIKILLILIMMMAIYVKADVSSVGIVPNYTTVLKGDIIKFDLGNDYLWDEAMVVSNYDEDTDKYEYQMTAENNYLGIPIYIVVDSDIFEIDISENKVPNSNYIFEDYKKTNNGDKTIYEFDLVLKDIKDQSNDSYNGLIDNILVSNLKLKVNENAESGTYYIETIQTDDFDSEYGADGYVVEKLPITIIDSEGDNTLNKFTLKTNSYGVAKNTDIEINVENKVNEIPYYGEINVSNLYCNNRCKVNGIGSDVYYDDEAKNLTYTVKYDNGKEDTFVIKNELDKATIDYKWAANYTKSVVIIDNGKMENSKELMNKIASSIENFKIAYDGFYYDYTKLNDTDKKILSNLSTSFDNLDEPYIFVIDDKNIVYSHHGNISDDELNNIQSEVTKKYNEELNNQDSRTISNCDDGVCTLPTEEQFNLVDFIKDNFMYVVICLSIIIIILILIITLINKKKRRENIL